MIGKKLQTKNLKTGKLVKFEIVDIEERNESFYYLKFLNTKNKGELLIISGLQLSMALSNGDAEFIE